MVILQILKYGKLTVIELTTKQESLDHWNRIITWVLTQNPEDQIDFEIMERAIGESWYTKFCSYCHEYTCKKCPLFKNPSCCNGLWDQLNVYMTWAEWIIKAERVRKYIEDNG